MEPLIESSISELYKSTIRAFPKTTKRQYAVDPVVVENIRWIPYQGVRTLYVGAEVRNESRHYKSIVLFKEVNFSKNEVYIKGQDGKFYKFGKLSLENSDVLLRCNCPDFKWRFNFYNHIDKSLFGSKRTKYESQGGPSANPMNLPGMCKHLMATIKVLKEFELFVN
jgi:hypothetical protein